MNRCKIFAAPSNGLWIGSASYRIKSRYRGVWLGKFEQAFFLWWQLEERLQRTHAASILVSYDPRVGPRLVDLPEQHPVRVAALQGNFNEKASGECRLAISAVVPIKWGFVLPKRHPTHPKLLSQ